jgi:hypothetical protein
LLNHVQPGHIIECRRRRRLRSWPRWQVKTEGRNGRAGRLPLTFLLQIVIWVWNEIFSHLVANKAGISHLAHLVRAWVRARECIRDKMGKSGEEENWQEAAAAAERENMSGARELETTMTYLFLTQPCSCVCVCVCGCVWGGAGGCTGGCRRRLPVPPDGAREFWLGGLWPMTWDSIYTARATRGQSSAAACSPNLARTSPCTV